jgi:hypothetical protein
VQRELVCPTLQGPTKRQPKRLRLPRRRRRRAKPPGVEEKEVEEVAAVAVVEEVAAGVVGAVVVETAETAKVETAAAVVVAEAAIRHATTAEGKVTLPVTAPAIAWKAMIVRSSTELGHSTAVASTAERLDTFPLTVRRLPVTRRATTVVGMVTLPVIAPIPGPLPLNKGTKRTAGTSAFRQFDPLNVLRRTLSHTNLEAAVVYVNVLLVMRLQIHDHVSYTEIV